MNFTLRVADVAAESFAYESVSFRAHRRRLVCDAD